jgi:AcrR family transcriptional regulator
VATANLRETKKARTRLALREAAVELFIAKGYDATTVAEIAAAAEVSEPTFFRYYPTKAAVVLAPLEHRIDLTLTALETLPGELPPLEACLTTVRSAEAAALLPAPIEAPYLRELRETASLRSAMLDAFDAATDRLSTEFARRLQRRPDELVVRQTAAVVVATLQEVFLQWAANTDDFDIVEAAVAAFEHLRAGLR